MTRWCILLACGDNLLSDDIPDLEIAHFCPGCGHWTRATGFYVYRDDDVDASLDPEFLDESTGQGRR